jgi:lysozyme
MTDAPKPAAATSPKSGTLVAILGATAAIGAVVGVAREESGRTVTAQVQADGHVAVHHVAGRQYLKAYRDSVGVWTACDGIAYVKPGATFTEEQCAAIDEAAIAKHAAPMMRCTPGLAGEGHDNQRIAATLLTYNIGDGAYCATARPMCKPGQRKGCSTSGIARKFNAGQYRAACDAFLAFSNAGGKPILRARRMRERALCLKDVRP